MKNDWFKLMLTGMAIFIMRITVLAHTTGDGGYEIKIHINEFSKDSIFLGYHMGNQTYIRDTAVLDKKTGFFTFKKEKKLESGVYLVVMPPDNNYFQIMVDETEQHFTVTTSTVDYYAEGKFKGSKDNDLFYNYMRFIATKRKEAEAISLKRSTDSSGTMKKLDALDTEVKNYQWDLVKKNPSSVTAVLIKSAIEVDIPKLENIKDKNENEIARYLMYKQHFFDNFDMSNPALLRTPVLYPRIDAYMEKMTPQHPDSIVESLDRILLLMKPNKEAFQFYFVHYLNKYAQSKLVGYDAIYVNLAKKYIATGLTDDFIQKDNKEKILQNADKLFPILIGKKAPEIRVFQKDSSLIGISDIKSKYTVLFFFEPTCGHCQKQSPFLVEFLQKAKEKKIDVKVMAICTFVGPDKMPECWKYVQEKGFGDFINAVDPYLISRYKSLYNIETTPQIYILDEQKIIRSKSIEAKQIGEVLDHIIQEDNEKLKKQLKSH